jgi:signal transduction histidine kinase
MAELPAQITALVDGLQDPALIVDAQHRVLRFNAAFQEFTGRRHRALLAAARGGTPCHALTGLEGCPGRCLAEQARAERRPIRLDELTASPDRETPRTVIVTSIPLPGIEAVVEVYRDVTAEARMHGRYRELLAAEVAAKSTLETVVQQRTDELLAVNDELRRTQSLLLHQEKMSALGQLVTGIAHELNNPISFVYGNIDFLAEHVQTLLGLVEGCASLPELGAAGRARVAELKEAGEYDYLREDAGKLLRSIRTGAERSVAIVRDLKVFSRSRPGVLEWSDLQAGLEATLNLLTNLWKNRIAIHRAYAPLPRVRCNFGHVNQVFMNILTNALQAMEGPGELFLETAVVGDHVRIAIRDTGPGLDEELKKKIFEPFFTTKTVGQGTGMGLAISDNIVRQHGGQLWVESAPGAGAMFVIDLPVDPGPAQ